MLESIFNPDNMVLSTINKIIDLVVVSILWIICCLPLITIGPASSALYYTVVKSIRKQRSYPVREFWSAFRNNFKKGIFFHLIITVLGLMMYLTDVPLILTFLANPGKVSSLFIILLSIKAFLLLGMICWIYPLISRYNENILVLAEAGLYMILRYCLRTIATILLLIITVIFLIWEPLFLVILPSFFMLLLSVLTEPVLKKVCRESKEQEKDQWYLTG